MDCFGKYGLCGNCRSCLHADGCKAINAYDKVAYRSNMRFALLKLTIEDANLRGIFKPAHVVDECDL